MRQTEDGMKQPHIGENILRRVSVTDRVACSKVSRTLESALTNRHSDSPFARFCRNEICRRNIQLPDNEAELCREEIYNVRSGPEAVRYWVRQVLVVGPVVV